MLQINISPINPPPGTPDITTPPNTEINIAVRYVPIPEKSCPNIPNSNDIFRIDDKQVPSICIVAPRGNTISLTSFLTPIFSVAARLTGNVAIEEQVAKEVYRRIEYVS